MSALSSRIFGNTAKGATLGAMLLGSVAAPFNAVTANDAAETPADIHDQIAISETHSGVTNIAAKTNVPGAVQRYPRADWFEALDASARAIILHADENMPNLRSAEMALNRMDEFKQFSIVVLGGGPKDGVELMMNEEPIGTFDHDGVIGGEVALAIKNELSRTSASYRPIKSAGIQPIAYNNE